MNDRARTQLALSKNSRPSSPKSSLAPGHSNPFTVNQAPHISSCATAENLTVQPTMLGSIITYGPFY